jgi:8-oxo-dGTP pyrophosphatase MutT (NUDIX family)
MALTAPLRMILPSGRSIPLIRVWAEKSSPWACSPADAARRELLEETGYAAGNLIHLGTWECNPALQTNRLHTFLGLDVEKVAEPAAELDERLEVMTVPQAHWHSDRIDSAFSHYFSSYAIELARAHVEIAKSDSCGDGRPGF